MDGSDGSVVLDSHGNPTYQPTTDTVTVGGLIGGTLLGDSIYMVTLHDNNGTPVVSNLTRIASGLRNAASMAIDPATGDLDLRRQRDRRQRLRQRGVERRRARPHPGGPDRRPDEYFGFPEVINGQLTESYVKTIDAAGRPGDGRQSRRRGPAADRVRAAGRPRPDHAGSESEGASGFALSPTEFPAGLNDGVFIGFHGVWNEGGTANDENPLIFADPSTGKYFDFVSNNEPGVGHFDGALSTSDSLFLADISKAGNMGSGGGQGVIYQIKAIANATPTPTPTPSPTPNHPPVLSPIPDQTVDEGIPLSVPVTASDPDAGQTIAYSLGRAHRRVRRSTPEPASSPGPPTPTRARAPIRSPSSPPTTARRP